ncbi:SgcJ/EcaC family oxidoreductase [Rhodohalobacter halophilus]|uniref:SgcJ/EcaC family oxidoreductase n=1 Tax=Rhodohalobacter halophilus TaxID=1812810 RepID=UPI001FE0F9E1|nr:SgcJ/EcaC family oxidoreductase [Rhodohalobacter halophilus]
MSKYSAITTPEEIPTRFAEGWNERDADKIAAIFDQDADFINVVGIWWENRDDIRTAHDYGLRVIFNDSNLRVGRVKVKYPAESVAVVHARMLLSGQSNVAGQSPQNRQTLFIFVAHKTKSGWSCVSAQNTDIVPGKETNANIDGSLESVDYRGQY